MLVASAALLWRRSPTRWSTIVGVWVPIALHAQLTGDGGEGLYLVWPAG